MLNSKILFIANRIKPYLFYCLVLMMPLATVANDNVRFVSQFEDRGLSSVTSMLEDSKGLLWIGSSNGLHKFNGEDLITYSYRYMDTTSLCDGYIYRIIEDSQGNIWTATRRGLNLYDPNFDRFRQFYYDPSDPNLSANEVTDVFEDSKGNLWVVTHHLNLLDRETGQFQTFLIDTCDRCQSPQSAIFVFEDNRGTLWVGTLNQLYSFNPTTRIFTCQLTFSELGSDLSVWSFRNNMVQDEEGKLWITINQVGLVSFRHEGGSLIDLNIHYPDGIGDGQLSDFRLMGIFLNDNGDIWIGTENSGLFRFNPKDGKFINYLHDSSDPSSIAENSVWTVYKDSFGRLWFGTFSRGISVIDPYHDKFDNIQKNPQRNSLSYNNVSALIVDENDNMWIGTDGGGLNYYDAKRNHFTHYQSDPNDPYSITRDAVISLSKDYDGNLWVGTWSGGLNLLRKNSSKFELIDGDGLLPRNSDVFALETDLSGNVYIGTYVLGMFIYNYRTDEWFHYIADENDPTSISYNWVFKFLFDRDSSLWIGTQNAGINIKRWDNDGNPYFQSFESDPNDTTTLSSYLVNTLYQDEQGYIWIGTNDGLNRMDPDTYKFKVYRIEDGLPDNTILGIVSDHNGHLWISTLNGLSHLNPNEETFRNYNSDDGLQGKVFNRNVALRSASGYLYFGGVNGISVFHPDSIRDNPYPPRVILTDFKLFNRTVPIGGDSPLEKHIGVTDRIVLDHQQSVFTIDFAALNFTRPEKNQYAFMMEGLEEEWNYVGNQRSATYTSLNPGRYTFRVKAANNDEVWSEVPLSLQIIIKSPYWQTWWFYSIVIIGLIFAAWYYIQQRVLALERNKALFEDKLRRDEQERNRERDIELAHQSGKAEVVSDVLHNIGNVLNSVYVSAVEMGKVLESSRLTGLVKAGEMLQLNRENIIDFIQHNPKGLPLLDYLIHLSKELTNERSKLNDELVLLLSKINVIKEILDLQKNFSKSTYFLESLSLNTIVNDALHILQQKISKSLVRVENNLDQSIEITTSKSLLTHVLVNIIKNAVEAMEHTPPFNRILTIHAKKDEHAYEILFSDRGEGIAPENLTKIFSHGYTTKAFGQGFGLHACANTMTELGGRIWATSKGAGQGAELHILIPYKNI